ncbi:MAG: type II toxin-antitoxin system YafQ family toxin [Candidatus Cloacimonetes bacterium]|nr:type II toxin-antitoxin system YafQ family toxin [Candidatus Cloacimonadota bacterium]
MGTTENNKYKIYRSKKFLKAVKVCQKRNYNMKLLDEVVEILSRGEKLPRKYKDHALKGKFKGTRECHILPDWLLTYKIYEDKLFLYLLDTGTHDDVF